MAEASPRGESSNFTPNNTSADVSTLPTNPPPNAQDLGHINVTLQLELAQLRLTNYTLDSQVKTLEKKIKASEFRATEYKERNNLLVDDNEAFQIRMERLRGENGDLKMRVGELEGEVERGEVGCKVLEWEVERLKGEVERLEGREVVGLVEGSGEEGEGEGGGGEKTEEEEEGGKQVGEKGEGREEVDMI